MVMVRVMANFRVSVKDEVRIVGFSVKVRFEMSQKILLKQQQQTTNNK